MTATLLELAQDDLHRVNIPRPNRILLAGKFVAAGTAAASAVTGYLAGADRTGTGAWSLNLANKFASLDSVHCTLLGAAAASYTISTISTSPTGTAAQITCQIYALPVGTAAPAVADPASITIQYLAVGVNPDDLL